MSILLPHRDRRLKPLPLEASIHSHDPLLYIERQTKHLQRNLQTLLDAQSEGLLAVLSGSDQDDAVSTTNSNPTPSVSSSSRAPTVPVRQPAHKKIGLHAARRGILKSMRQLLALKEEEQRILTIQSDERRSAIGQVESFMSKQKGLENTISTIQDDHDSRRCHDLKDEARRLEHEISELENKLFEMKARHRTVVNEIAGVENSVEAKLSSYKASLSLLESEVRKYLRHPPLVPLSVEATFYSLNPKRRTLEMAKEHWAMEQSELDKRKDSVLSEVGALDEGSAVWQAVVKDVTDFEKRLRDEMSRLFQGNSQLLDTQDSLGESTGEKAKAILKDMEDTTNRIEEKLDLAEEKDWKLLVCCIGAELEALREGRAMLLDLFNLSSDSFRTAPECESTEAKPDDIPAAEEEHNDPHGDPLSMDNPEPPPDLLRDTSPSHEATRSEDEDDEPDPAWLLSDP
ncbi:conserved hypothetical protein [Paecilomyces variotii No. 5]|uniref:Autophagy-related protein Atg28 n=1 Tax=Byssochlamys spectabilis (strain No. 5 / NBRC 109023) TaxID=1356009 RepID=V5FUV1_BYSSN|nr:conserved hypothetical protein [Paecilomyces variotii No. 5]